MNIIKKAFCKILRSGGVSWRLSKKIEFIDHVKNKLQENNYEFSICCIFIYMV